MDAEGGAAVVAQVGVAAEDADFEDLLSDVARSAVADARLG